MDLKKEFNNFEVEQSYVRYREIFEKLLKDNDEFLKSFDSLAKIE